MKTQHSLKKSCDSYPRRAGMGAQTPKAAGGGVPFRTTEPYSSLPSAPGVESMTDVLDTATASSWHTPESTNYEDEQERENRDRNRGRGTHADTTWNHISKRAIPEQLADLLMDIIPGMEGAELGEAFRDASDLPPVTTQSLSELDVPNIITNMKLRHDINFDKDLSFRPNLDGPRGQEKRRCSDMYWRSLVAELELYGYLFQRTPLSNHEEEEKWAILVQHAQRRIPKVFRTLHDILESLVPVRDHARVGEHFDVPMLMQEIERGVVDLVRRVEWVASLLKEHCAPMRDGLVDKMVQTTKVGVATNDAAHIVTGLRELLGILEAMKLDVANHQIRNLKALLIEDTVNFEKHYHLERLVRGRSKVDINAAQKWWTLVDQGSHTHESAANDVPYFRLEIFTRAVVNYLFAENYQPKLPDTFYLDKDRMGAIKLEIDDLVYFEICFDMFGQYLKEFAYSGPISNTTRSELRNVLSAIIGDRAGHAPGSWFFHSESLSLEIYRQAILLAGRPFICDSHQLQRANQHLQDIFQNHFSSYASKVRDVVLSQVLTCTHNYHNASPFELFDKLATPSISVSLSFAASPAASESSCLQSNTNTLTYFADRFIDISRRITHITILHWRVWGPIAYITGDDSPAPATSPQHTLRPPLMTSASTIKDASQLHTLIPAPPMSPLSLSSPSPHLLHGISAPTPPPTLHTNPPPLPVSSTEISRAGVERGSPPTTNSELVDDEAVKSKRHRFGWKEGGDV